MMNPHELRDPANLRQWIAQGLWLARVVPARTAQTAHLLEWAIALASEGEPVPPIGFIADVGHLLFGAAAPTADHHVPAPFLRTYEDYALGKIIADPAFERASDAVRQYQGRDRVKGLVFVLQQMRARANISGVVLSPGSLKSLQDVREEELLAEGWDSLQNEGVIPLLGSMYDELVVAMRNSPEVLGAEDVFELERRTALASFGQRVALRQVLQTAKSFEEALPLQKPRFSGRRHDVPTRIFEEDTYPVGGFASISTRGSIESLLHSQLAYMERGDRPDLFDVKFLRDELLYYSRDENSFLRRRSTFVLALYPDLIDARVKDVELPGQRIILLLALMIVAINKLSDWLTTDSLQFAIVFIEEKNVAVLSEEKELLEVLLSDQIASGSVTVETLDADRLPPLVESRGRRSLCHCLLASGAERTLNVDGADVSRLVLDGPVPWLGLADEPARNSDSLAAGWIDTLTRLLVHWI